MTSAAHIPAKVARSNSAFVDATLRVRLPEILRSIEQELHLRGCSEQIWEMWRAMVHEQPMDPRLFALSSPFWQSYLSQWTAPTWRALPFFDLEFLFYHAINSWTGYWQDGFDVFARTKTSALEAAVTNERAGLARVMPGLDARAGLSRAISSALLGNQADLSQLDYLQRASGGEQSRVLLDESERLLDRLLDPACDRVHLLLDNAGAELCFDLALVDTVLRLSHAQVVLHAKPCPMFVSDARPDDVLQTINAFQLVGTDLAACGRRLETALAAERLVLRAEPDWGEPRDFSKLSTTLLAELKAAHVVIAKGDLNYRRFLEDRLWPLDTPADIATGQVPFRAFCLRVLKSDVMVGLDVETAARAQTLDPNWRTSGKFAVIERL